MNTSMHLNRVDYVRRDDYPDALYPFQTVKVGTGPENELTLFVSKDSAEKARELARALDQAADGLEQLLIEAMAPAKAVA